MINPTLLAACLLGLCAAPATAQTATPTAKPAAKKNAPLPEAPVRGEQIPPATGANVDESKVVKTLYVAPNGTENAPGTQAQPMKIVAALQSAFADKARGVGVKVIVGPGTYRESLGSYKANLFAVQGEGVMEANEALLVIEAERTGTVLVSGSDVWSNGWTREGRRLTHDWPYQWKALTQVGGAKWLPPLGYRREMVYVGGARLRHVLTSEELKPGTFHVGINAEGVTTGPLTLVLPEGAPGDAPIEVVVREKLLDIAGHPNVVLRGLRFSHSRATAGAVSLRASRNVLIKECRFDENLTQGLDVSEFNYRDGKGCRDVTLRRTSWNHNGYMGLVSAGGRNVLIEECEGSDNNWRGEWINWYRWAPCGLKFLRMNTVTFRRHRAIGNRATGVWMDTQNVNTRIEDSLVQNNLRGIHIEGDDGPTLITRTLVVGNRVEPKPAPPWVHGSGIVLSQTPYVTLTNNICYDNDVAQIGVWDTFIARQHPGSNGQLVEVRTVDLVVEGNVLVSRGKNQHALHMGDKEMDEGRFLASFRSDNNLFWDEDGPVTFLLGPVAPNVRDTEEEDRMTTATRRPDAKSAAPISLETWRRETGQDKNSRVADPKFKAPEKGDFSLFPNSPLQGIKLPPVPTP